MRLPHIAQRKHTFLVKTTEKSKSQKQSHKKAQYQEEHELYTIQ